MDRSEFKRRYINARREAISLDFEHLNGAQREAVMATQGPVLLLAGAGSGKTTVLMNRIVNLLKYGCGSDSEYVPETATEDDLLFLEKQISEGPNRESARLRELCAVDAVDPWRIIAITFTNKAAGEMKHRLERMLGQGSEDIWAMTFHSACARILMRDIDRLGYDKSFTIYDTSDSASLMKRILKDFDIEERSLPHKAVLANISRAKDAMVSADDYIASAEKSFDSRKKIIGRAYLEYANRMKSSNSLDFDDLILLAVKLFAENHDVLERYQKRFKYVLVDEYQDTNNLQYLLAAAFAGGHSNICVVGDDDQSIYKFRGATIENILSFEKKFKNTRVIRLEQNYRSTGYILNAANDVIRNNNGRKGKKLWTDNEIGEKPSLCITEDERAEAQFAADTIIESVAAGRNWRDHAVLYRMNAQSNQFETAFKRAGVPYRIFGGTGFYDRAEIKDMLAYLCVIHNPNDDIRLLRIINNPPRGIGSTTEGRLSELAAQLGVSLFEAIKSSHAHEQLLPSAARLHLFSDMIDDLREYSDSHSLDELYDALINRTGYIRMLEEKGSDENIARIENVRELKTNIVSFLNENGGSLFDFLSETALFTDLDRDDQSADRALMMTMHSAKGLEFDTVFIVGAEEGIFPGVRSIGAPEEMEEERRLCYVAMTRAMRKLYFTSTQRRMLFGKTAAAQPSRFIREIGDDNIDIHEPKRSFSSIGFDFSSDLAINISGGFGRNGSADSRKPLSRSRASAPGSAALSAHRYTATVSNAPLPSSGSQLSVGDVVEHRAFGRGVIIGKSPAGGDALLEIAFDSEGTKRMLFNSAIRYMTKI